MDKTKNVFISHYHEDEENIEKLKDLLSAKGYQIKNSSISRSRPNFAKNPEYVKRLLRMRIHWAGTFICLIGPKTSTREWVDWEVEQASKKGKRIVGVFINGASSSEIPENLKKYRNALVCWKADKIIGAIEGEINYSENPDESQREQDFLIIREICKT
jgi:hypothetical protein